MLKLATTFSGIGAIEHALKRLGIDNKIIFASDNDKYVKETYFENHDINENRWIDLVQDIDGKKYKNKIDLLVGGSPCQSFSMVGKRAGFKDPRGNLFFEFARIIDEAKPKAFIFENVKGLLSHDSGKTWKTITETFDKLGYNYYPKILNAKDYGIPQHRERLFVVGFRDKRKKFDFPDVLDLKIILQDLLEDNPDSKYFLGDKGKKFVSSEKNLKKRYTQINGKIALCQKRNQQFNWHGDFICVPSGKVDKKYFLSKKTTKYVMSTGTKNFYSKPKINLNIARPLLATMAKMHRAGVDNYISRGDEIRKLTPRECLRLMGFDDTFKIIVSDTQAYKQAGNSIVVNVLMAIIKNMKLEK